MPRQSTRRREGYLPLESYAALGDGWTVALSGADGAIDWWCAPALDSEPILDRLLDAEAGGRFVVRPRRPFTVERHYLPDSNLLAAEFTTADGRARLTEGMALEETGAPSRSNLVRRVEGLEGRVGFTVDFRPVAAADSRCELLATPELSWKRTGRALKAEFSVSAGEKRVLSLTVPAEGRRLEPGSELDRADRTWRAWANALTPPPAHAELVRRHALALKLLCAPSGAIPAAATTSLPEKMGGERNWDFRYVWVRDAAYTIETLIQIGAVTDAARAFNWLACRIARHGPRVAFDLDGAVAPTDRVLDLPGYRNSRPVHAGNLATLQSQHGVFGDMLQAAVRLTGAGETLEQGAVDVLVTLADDCARSWTQPDSGIWELSELRLYANSRISCWQALTCAVSLSEAGHLPAARRDAWAATRDEIAAWIEDCCWCPERQSYVAWPGSDVIDASLALIVRLGYGSQERQAATIRAIDGALRTGLFHHRMSGVEESEGCFLACSFWLVEAKARLDRREEAAADFEALVAALGGIGVLPEMVEAGSGRWLGNMPQGLTHLALIQAAVALSGS
jgi:GH15 family glucan-1,4-alpha-glucosidase